MQVWNFREKRSFLGYLLAALHKLLLVNFAINQLDGVTDSILAFEAGRLGSILSRVIPKTFLKWYSQLPSCQPALWVSVKIHLGVVDRGGRWQ